MKILVLLCLFMLASRGMRAQEVGQICVGAFADRDGDGARGPGEAALTRGIGASLLNAAGVVLDAALLEDSPYAADGLLCFGGLPQGAYELRATSAEFAPTTAFAFAAEVIPGQAPPRQDFGFSPLFPPEEASPLDWLREESLAALAVVIAAVAFVATVLAALATLVCLRLLRRRQNLRARLILDDRSQPAAPAPRQPPPESPGRASPPLFAADEIDAADAFATTERSSEP